MAEPRSWIVWSNEHGAFWRPARRGYTQLIEEAGRYTRSEAEAICEDVLRREGEPPDEICMPAPEALDLSPKTAERLLKLRMALNTGAGLDDAAAIHEHQVTLDRLERGERT